MAGVTVVFPIYFDTDNVVGLEIDEKRIKEGDDDYIEEVREKLKKLAEGYLQLGVPDDPIITNSELEELEE